MGKDYKMVTFETPSRYGQWLMRQRGIEIISVIAVCDEIVVTYY